MQLILLRIFIMVTSAVTGAVIGDAVGRWLAQRRIDKHVDAQLKLLQDPKVPEKQKQAIMQMMVPPNKKGGDS